MWSYYELTIAQTLADRQASAGYAVSPAAVHEFPKDAITRALAEHSQPERTREQSARQTANKILYGAIKAFFRRAVAVDG